MSNFSPSFHSLTRTSLQGKSFIGRCTLCGAEGLGIHDALKECPNPRGVSQEDALLEAIDPERGEENDNA